MSTYDMIVQEGIEKGIEKGRRQERKEMTVNAIKNMKGEGFATEVIARILDISVDEVIEMIKDEL